MSQRNMQTSEQKILSPVESVSFEFPNIIDILAGGDNTPPIRTALVQAHGYQWRMRHDSSTDSSFISVCLELVSSDNNVEDVEFKYNFPVSQHAVFDSRSYMFSPGTLPTSHRIYKSTILSNPTKYLVEGSLLVDVNIRTLLPRWQPNTMNKENHCLIADLWNNPKCSDVTVVIQNKDFFLHKFLLESRAPALFALINDGSTDEDEQNNQNNRLEIENNVDVDLFEVAMKYLYTGKIAKDFLTDVNQAKALLDTVNRFGCTSLKLRLDVEMSKLVTVANAATLLVIADSHCCASLKETCINEFKEHSHGVTESSGWDLVKESPQLLAELVQMLIGPKETEPERHSIEEWDVSSLRHRLKAGGAHGEALDGSREMLVNRVKALLDTQNNSAQ